MEDEQSDEGHEQSEPVTPKSSKANKVAPKTPKSSVASKKSMPKSHKPDGASQAKHGNGNKK